MAKISSDNQIKKEALRGRFSFAIKIQQKIKNLFIKAKMLSKRQKILYMGIVSGVLVLLLLIFSWFMVFAKKHHKQSQSSNIVSLKQKEPQNNDEEISEEILQSLPKAEKLITPIDNKQLDNLIKKADTFYVNGDIKEALNLFDRIANFSQSLANYNLGVVQLKQKEYAKAIKSFQEAINTGEDVSLNAFNAGISARYLNDEKTYRYYLDLAARELSKENQEAFYSYLYALIQFYNQNYFATLSALTHPSSKAYIPQGNDLLFKTFLIFNDNVGAIKTLEENFQKDLKTLGLLYARIGDYDKAEEYLLKYSKKNPNDYQAQMALQIIFLKIRDFANASKFLEALNVSKDIQKQVFKTYPIKVVLHPKFFDINLAQEVFVKKILDPKGMSSYKLLFYYAPFKIFNIHDALGALQEGGMISGQNLQGSEEKMFQSQTIAQIDRSIVEALSYINQKRLRKALSILQKVLEKNPNHSILHYNAGLLYAQMEDYSKAYMHFIKAYYLNTKEIDSAMYAILTSYFLNKNTSRIQDEITKNFENLAISDSAQRRFLLAFLGYLNDNIADEMLWIEDIKDKKSIYYALKAAYGIRSKNQQALVSAFGALKKMHQGDFITDIFYAVAQNFNTNFKQTALKLHNLFVKNYLDLNNAYYGPAIAREFYAQIGFITGSLQTQENLLKEKLTSSSGDNNGILQALALVNIYQHKFVQAYDIYNTLINQLGENDARTQFLAAVSAVGLKDKDNAALFLQLSKMDTESEFEARFALGMLYQQVGNFAAAASHYNMVVGRSFDLDFFDFEIDTQKILSQ